MAAIEPRSTSDTYFIDGRNLSGTTGTLFGRATSGGAGLVALERLAVRLVTQTAHYDALHDHFERKKVFLFEIHRGLQVRLSTMAVISQLERNADSASCLVELELM